MKYTIKKDVAPKTTVSKIEAILDTVGIDVDVNKNNIGESYFCRIFIPSFGIKTGTNGKGTSEINSLASGYAEFMERLQTQCLFGFKNNGYEYDSDEKLVKIDGYSDVIIENELKNHKDNIIKILKIFHSDFCKWKKEGLISASPYISYKNKKQLYISCELMSLITGTNGYAAGNTYEEAIVQGISEVLERYCMKNIFLKKIKMPLIPKEIFEKYDKLSYLINEIESLGYKITIKDASLGLNFPTICCIIEDLTHPKNGVCIKFGTHPYFPIALERCLTEFMQGGNIETREEEKKFVKSNNLKAKNIIINIFATKTCFNKTNTQIANILSGEADYKFNKKAWFFDEKITNKQMFHYLVKLILKHSDDIYIRNCSFLGFPTVKIYIPKLSSPFVLDEKFFDIHKRIYEWTRYACEKELPQDSTIQNLMECCKYIREFELEKIENVINLGHLNARYLGVFCAMVLNNKKETRRFLKRILRYLIQTSAPNSQNNLLRYYQTLKTYFELKWKNVSQDEIKEKIEKKYSKQNYEKLMLTLEVTTQKRIMETFFIKDDVPINENNEKIIKKLGEIYKNNPPNQNEILKIIKKSNFFQKLFIS